MKKSLLWVVLLGVSLGLSSCKDDDPDPAAPIVGTWALKNYELTDFPAGFAKYNEGRETNYILGVEVGYTILFNTDGTYSRAYLLDETYQGAISVYDKGKWTLDGANLKLTPSSTTDVNLIEGYGATPGTAFTVQGEITEAKVTLAVTGVVLAIPDSYPEEELDDATRDDAEAVDCTILLIFNKL